MNRTSTFPARQGTIWRDATDRVSGPARLRILGQEWKEFQLKVVDDAPSRVAGKPVYRRDRACVSPGAVGSRRLDKHTTEHECHEPAAQLKER
jgi:hypothetical protein